MGRLAVASLLGVSLALGCGGRTLEAPAAADGGVTGTGGSAAKVYPGNPTSGFNGSVTLPPCKLGLELAKAPGKQCAFLTAGRCYDTKIDACACACPNRSGTTCTSGFPNSQGQVLVTCS